MAYHGLLLLRCTHDHVDRDTLRLACRAALNLLTREGLAQSLHGGHLFPPACAHPADVISDVIPQLPQRDSQVKSKFAQL